MSRISIICIPAFAILAACNSAPDNGTSQAETEAVAGDDGAMAAPDPASNTDGSNMDGTAGSMDASGDTSGAGTMSGPAESAETETGTGGTAPNDAGAGSGTSGTDGQKGTTPPPEK
ncbi:MAG TPA: hypothetical protein VN047_01350 [Sphingopyxis sp.]|uniref:hypothetical protein n=1 Tax=Sphingopyxis sp. TaxID=1908224 RepID=UPI002C67A1B3|nr:hypothetical protein [Sphingopyxis sp.]HWW55517.1 hypothetical protein [Sphingopyxis sp.]